VRALLSSPEPRWLPLEIIIKINQAEVEETGENHALLRPELLESAWARPKNLWGYKGESDMVALAASLLFGIVRNHPFEQGNKRTGLTATVVFLASNGYRFAMPDDDSTAAAILALVEGDVSEDDFVHHIRRFIVQI
jgi:death-on-curing protein